MAAGPDDTSPDAARMAIQLALSMSPEAKLQQVAALIGATRELALAGLRSRYPQASERELLLRYAALVLDPEPVLKAYGWDPTTGAPPC